MSKREDIRPQGDKRYGGRDDCSQLKTEVDKGQSPASDARQGDRDEHVE